MKRILLTAMLALGVSVLPFSSVANASEMDQSTKFTFSQPVELPGMVLPAGTYVFRVPDNVDLHNVVQIWDRDQRHLLGTFLTIPEERRTSKDEPTIRLEERKGNAPMAIGNWFYPGRLTGHEFLYSRS